MVRSPATARKRLYRQVARAHAANETGRKILAAAAELFTERVYEDVSLEDVAAHAGVTSKTIRRRFGSKDQLALQVVEAAAKQNQEARDAVPAGDVEGALHMIHGMYEVAGDSVMRYLGVEERNPTMKAMADKGRELHVAWVERVFGPLCSRKASRRRVQLALLIVATDVFTWKLLRRDRGFSLDETIAGSRELVYSALEPHAPTRGE